MLMPSDETRTVAISGLAHGPQEQDDRRWFVLCCEPQGELRGFRWLSYSGFSAYCPVMKRSVAQNFNRRRIVTHPIFRGYLFVRLLHSGDLSDQVERCPVTLRWLRVDDRPATLHDAAIEAIKDKEAEIAKISRGKPKPIDIAVNDEVQIMTGPYAYFRAVVSNLDRLDDKGRIGILIDIFGRLAPTEVSVNQVRLV